MRKSLVVFLLAGLFGITPAMAQDNHEKDSLALRADSINLDLLKSDVADNIAIVSLDDNDIDEGGLQAMTSSLIGGRDPFYSAASFNFSAARFRVRGYDGDYSSVFMNGAPMENLDNGFSPYGLWGGLNNVTRFKDLAIGLMPNSFSFGELGSATAIDARPSKFRKQLQVDYSFSNRSFTHRLGVTYSSGIDKKGWSYTLSANRRYADEGYIPGTYYNGWSYYAGIDKKVGTKHTFSLVGFGSPTETGRAAAAVKEAQDLTGDHFYNPYWGYQEGKKRNGYVSKTNQPVFIFTHDYKINKNATVLSALSYSFGERSSSFIDRYNAADPRPDYYRYLPSYQDSAYSRDQVTALWQSKDPNVTQINWNDLYMGNRNTETVNGTTGKRSYYWIGDYVTKNQRFNLNSVVNTKVGKHTSYSGGITYQYQKSDYFQRAEDLLGGDYFVNWNQFAERDFPANADAKQNDLNNPDRIVRKGDRYGYDYDVTFSKISAWSQLVYKTKKFDYFFGLQLSHTSYWRTGNVRNGVVPDDSYGDAITQRFANYALKGGVTYHVDKQNSFYINASMLTKAPYYDNVYRSVRTRNTVQNGIENELVKTIEGGYVLYAPNFKLRLSGYYTTIENQMDVKVFYDESFGTLVSYALNSMNKTHFGGELGFEARLAQGLTLNGAASAGRYYFSNRPQVTITADNQPDLNKSSTVYAENYRIGGTPQEAYSLGLSYRSRKYWSVSLTGNYFDQMWMDMNPVRRTAEYTSGVEYKSDKWNTILQQEKVPGQFTLDFYGSWSYKLPKNISGKRRTFLVLSAGVSNILDNKDLITGGFEQLRADYTEKDVTKFPTKYYYGFGRNYFASIAIRRN